MRFYIFNFIDISEESFTVIFDCDKFFNKEFLLNDVKTFFSKHSRSKKSIYLYPNITNDESRINVKKDISDILNMPKDDIILLGYNENGIEENQYTNEVIRNGILKIITVRNAILESDDTFHYILPSEKHSPFFIRTGNILSYSFEINFIALSLLDKIKNITINEIACDTSSIMAIPYALNYLKSLFNASYSIPFKSFGSYSDVTTFPFKPRTLVLISASSSSSLENLIRSDINEKDLEIVSIIFNCQEETDKLFLINIYQEFNNLIINKSHKQFKPPEEPCEYCKRNSIPVLVRGEQFIPSRTLIQQVLIDKNDIPDWFTYTINNLVCQESVYAFRRETVSSKRRDIFFDVIKLYESSFANTINKYVEDNIKAKINILIHLNDGASKYISTQIKQLLEAKYHSSIHMASVDKIEELQNDEELNFLVVASCITTGRNFHDISREMRKFTKSSIFYLSIITRLNDIDKLTLLKKNLEFKADKKSNFKNYFYSIVDCYLGDYNDSSPIYDRPSWEDETNLWENKNIEFQYIHDRLKDLKNEKGLINNLFFKNPFNGHDLKLRENFALHKFNDGQMPSQADTYFIMSGIFHYLRNPKNIKASKDLDPKYLLQHEHVRTIIDPLCFERFNDGILQSCILRIAKYSELNYSLSEIESTNMLKTLKRLFNEENEAITEFLYSILIGKLKLRKQDLGDLMGFIASKYNNEIISFFINEIKGNQANIYI